MSFLPTSGVALTMDEYWRTTYLSYDTLINHARVSNKFCYGHAKNFEACIRSFNEFIGTADQKFYLKPANTPLPLYSDTGTTLLETQNYSVIAIERTASFFSNLRELHEARHGYQNALVRGVERLYRAIQQDPSFGPIVSAVPRADCFPLPERTPNVSDNFHFANTSIIDFCKLFQWGRNLVADQEDYKQAIGAAINISLQMRHNDPRYRYVPLQYVDDLENRRDNNTFFGVGMQITQWAGETVVQGIIANTPAQRAKLWEHDIITHIDGTPLFGMAIQDIGELMRDTEPSEISISVRRNGTELEPFVFQREVFQNPRVESRTLPTRTDATIGYLRIHLLQSMDICEEVKNHLQGLEAEGVSGLILDLRRNPGGSLPHSVCIAGLFLDKDLTITRKKDIRAPVRIRIEPGVSLEEADDEGNYTPRAMWEAPPQYNLRHDHLTSISHVVVLTSDTSGSGAELIAGALRDYQRAWLLGRNSFGKGTVQTGVPFRELHNVQMFRTTDYFILPGGTSNQAYGVDVDFDRFEDPDASPDERFEVRVANRFFHWTVPDGIPQWEQPRQERVDQLEECMTQTGVARNRFDNEKGTTRSNPDFQLYSALDLLHCEITGT